MLVIHHYRYMLMSHVYLITFSEQNVLRAMEEARVAARDRSSNAVAEATLRAQIVSCTSKCDGAVADAAYAKRQSQLLSDELRQVKTKLSCAVAEKSRLERDHRAAAQLQKTMQQHSSTDAEYHKRKNVELNTHVQGLNGTFSLL